MIDVIAVSTMMATANPKYSNTLTNESDRVRRSEYYFDPRNCYSLTQPVQRREIFCENALSNTHVYSSIKVKDTFDIGETQAVGAVANELFNGSKPLDGEALDALELAFFDVF